MLTVYVDFLTVEAYSYVQEVVCKNCLCTACYVTVKKYFILNFKGKKKIQNFKTKFLTLLNLKRYQKTVLSKLNDLTKKRKRLCFSIKTF